MDAVCVTEINDASVILSLRKVLSNKQTIRKEAHKLKIPILVIKSDSFHQVQRGLNRLIKRNKSYIESLSSKNDLLDQENIAAALEECRLALEKIVVPLGKPVDLLPRSEKIIEMQSELVRKYRLSFDIFEELNAKRLRVYPP